MIPTIEDIVRGLIAGAVDEQQAVAWLNSHMAAARAELQSELKDFALRPTFGGADDREDGEPQHTGWECLICGVLEPKFQTFEHLDECLLMVKR